MFCGHFTFKRLAFSAAVTLLSCCILARSSSIRLAIYILFFCVSFVAPAQAAGFTFAGIADWDGDGNQDIVARDNRDGLLWLYPGQSKRGYSQQSRVQIGNGW